ncbi:MAG: hypothetical protein LBQ62_06460 [Candidatus Accumulibacter sp.]|jgi:hypothetical protein|nr:hypothetical protein [Accumulibacter sp.]
MTINPLVSLNRLAVLISLFTISPSIPAGENRAHEESRLGLIKNIQEILIMEKLCISESDCTKKQLFFVSPATNGLGVKTYSITDPVVLMKIAEKCMDVFYRESKLSVYMDNHDISKHEELENFFWKNPFNHVEFKRIK